MVETDFCLEQALLYCDEDLLALNKPPGLRVIPDGYQPHLPHLSGLLNAAFGRVWVVHRLDKDTSGVILFARNATAHRLLNHQFEQRQVAKTYHALVHGVPTWEELTIHAPLRVNGDRRHRTVANHPEGKAAETTVKVLERFVRISLLQAQPHTGYTHQIRAHLTSAGFPLLADPLYNQLHPGENSLIARTALHARAIQFLHPCQKILLSFDAPYPPDFESALRHLRSE